MAVSQASAPFTLLLGVLVALTALGMDMFLPSVPVIARAFGTEPGAAQLTVTTYLIGLAIGQLAWGPVSDRFGRKPVLLAGLALFLVSSACGALAQSAQAVVLIRFAQGVGMSSGPVIARSIVRDLYAREQAAQLLARMMAVFGIIPVAAPLIGGQAIALSGWPAVFWVLAAIAHWSAVVLPMIVYLFGCSFMVPNATAAALSPFPQMAGSASSLLGALPFGLGAAVSAALAAAFDGSTRPMALTIALFGIAAFLAEKFYFRKIVHG